jgi:hypothetical protein
MHMPNHFAYRLLNKTCIFLALVFPGEMEGCAATKSFMLVPKWENVLRFAVLVTTVALAAAMYLGI